MTERRNDGYDLARALGCEVQFFKGEVCWCSPHHLEHIPPRDDSLDDLFAVVRKEWADEYVTVAISRDPRTGRHRAAFVGWGIEGKGPTDAAALCEAVMAALEAQKGERE